MAFYFVQINRHRKDEYSHIDLRRYWGLVLEAVFNGGYESEVVVFSCFCG